MTDSIHHYLSLRLEEKAWGIYVTSAGRAVLHAEDDYPPSGHPAGYAFDWKRGRVLDEFVLLLVTKGRGKFESRRTGLADLSAGECALVYPNEWHRYRPNSSSGWTEYWITFDGGFPRQWLEARLLPPDLSILRNLTHAAARLVEEILLECAAGSTQLRLSGLCHSLIAHVLESAPMKPHRAETDVLCRAADRLRNPFIRVKVPSLARVSGMSESTFRRKFKENFGVSPQHYARVERIGKAKRMLIETDFPIKVISSQLGFSSEYYFMRTFRAIAGDTPARWRAENLRHIESRPEPNSDRSG